MARGRPKASRCYNCRWWDRSWNFKNQERDWGDCHFWGQAVCNPIVGGHVSKWSGPSPRGSDTCKAYNAEPGLIGKMDPAQDGPSRPRGDE